MLHMKARVYIDYLGHVFDYIFMDMRKRGLTKGSNKEKSSEEA